MVGGSMTDVRTGACNARWWRLIASCVVMALAGCAVSPDGAPGKGAGAASGEQRLATPWLTLTGARFAQAADAGGTPSLRSGPLAYQRFISPSAVAALGNELYIVDAGAGAVFRFDLALSAMTPVKGVAAHTSTQLFVASDFSLYALDVQNRRVLQFARSGQLLATFGDNVNLARPVDVVVDEARGLVLVADGVFNQIVAFHPLGRASHVIHLRGDERNRVLSIAALAVGADALYVSDPACRCIARVARDGAVLDTFGHHAIGQPGPLAVDRYGRVFVVDRFDRSLKVFARGRLVASVTAASLGLLQLSDLWIYDGWLVIADAAGARVELMRLAPPAEGE